MTQNEERFCFERWCFWFILRLQLPFMDFFHKFHLGLLHRTLLCTAVGEDLKSNNLKYNVSVLRPETVQ